MISNEVVQNLHLMTKSKSIQAFCWEPRPFRPPISLLVTQIPISSIRVVIEGIPRGHPNIWNNKNKCVFDKRTIKVCVNCSLWCHGTLAQARQTWQISLYRASLGPFKGPRQRRGSCWEEQRTPTKGHWFALFPCKWIIFPYLPPPLTFDHCLRPTWFPAYWIVGFKNDDFAIILTFREYKVEFFLEFQAFSDLTLFQKSLLYQNSWQKCQRVSIK